MRPSPPPGRPTLAGRLTGVLSGILRDQGGIALVLTLLVVTLLSAMIIEFDYRTRLDVRAAANFRDATQAQLLANSGVEVVKGALQFDLQTSPSYDGYDEMWAYFNDAPPISVPDIPDARVTVRVDDEGGKLDLNSLVKDGNDDPDRTAMYRRLLDQVLAGEEVASPDRYDVDDLMDSLMDWLDPNLSPRTNGAEAPYYGRQDPPYTCADGPLHTIDELRLVQGYDQALVDVLRRHVTVVWKGGRPVVSGKGGTPSQININTISADLLGSLIPAFDVGAAGDLVSYIQGDQPHPVTDTTWQGLLNFYPEFGIEQTARNMAKFVQPRSDLFAVHITVEIVGEGAPGRTEVRARRSVETLLHRTPSAGGGTEVLSWRSE